MKYNTAEAKQVGWAKSRDFSTNWVMVLSLTLIIYFCRY